MVGHVGILGVPYVSGGFVASNYGTVFAEWDFSDTSTITELGGAVSAVIDKSGNGRTVAQATGANQPITGTRTIGGLNALDFQGLTNSHNLRITGITLAQPMTIVAVAQSDNPDLSPRCIFGKQNGPAFGTSSTDTWRYIAGSNRAFGTEDTSPHLFVVTFDGASSSFRLDGVAISTADPGSNGWVTNPMEIGCQNSSNFWDGIIGHILVYTAISDLSGLESVLMSKWGL